MECSKCGFKNPDKAKFCIECGTPIEFLCPNCGSETSASGKFCMECGFKLKPSQKSSHRELTFDEKIDKIQRYLPKGVTQKILSQRGKIEGERKQVTVMFCDIEGFTTLVEQLGAEDAYNIMDQIYEILIHQVHDYEGTVNEMTGDGIMALFGAPIAVEDAPQRAIRAGMSIHREIVKFNEQNRDNIAKPIKMRIGIHTGSVVVGTLGNDLRVEFKAVGDTVNLASRMENLAQPGSTYVSENTFKVAEGFFRFESLGERKIKGKKDPVKIYRVIASSSSRTRFDVNAEKGLTPFIGKDREIEALIDGFERSKAGRGRIFSITADAGVGKSRLLYEFRKAVANEDITFLEGKCLSYGRAMTYHPIIDILQSIFNVGDLDPDQVIREKVVTSLQNIGIKKTDTLPYFLDLLSVADSGVDKVMMSSEGKKAQIIEALKQFVLKGSEIRPLVMVVEDLHWIDVSSEDVINALLPSIPAARILLVITYRTEYSPPWKGKSYHNQMTLNRLSNRESLKLLYHLIGVDDLPADFEELVLLKTEGIPFYIEELIKSLHDLDIRDQQDYLMIARGEHSISMPSTIQDIIMSRVDRLPEMAKEILHFMSVIGREAGYELLKKATAIPGEEIISSMTRLIDSEILYERGIFPDTIYVFKHAISQEVIYDSLLAQKKKHLHGVVGGAIEEMSKDNPTECYGILSEHFMLSEDYEKSIAYSKLAGKSAQRRSAFKDAMSYAQKSIYCLEKLPESYEVNKQIIDIRTTLAFYAISLNYHIEARNAVAPIIDLAVNLDYKRSLPRIFISTGTYEIYHNENIPKGIDELKRAFNISESIGDFLSLWTACYHLGCALSFECDYTNSLHNYTKALDLSLAAGNKTGLTLVKGSIAAFNYSPQGETELAVMIGREGLLAAKESGDIYLEGFAHSLYGSSCFNNGLFIEAEDSLLKGVALCEKTSHFLFGAWAALFLGSLYIEKEEYENALFYFEKGNTLIDQGHFAIKNLLKICAIYAESKQNSFNHDADALANYYQKNKINCLDGWIHRTICMILMNSNSRNYDEAENCIEQAIESDRNRGLNWHLAMDYRVYSDLHRIKGDGIKAQSALEKAIDIFKSCNAQGWVHRTKIL